MRLGRLAGLAAAMALGLSLAVGAAPPAGSPHWAGIVEGSAPLSGGLDKARAAALVDAKTIAVRYYISLRVPPGVRQEKAAELTRILGSLDSWVAAWEVQGETPREGKLVLRVKIELDRDKLDAALKSAGLVPSRDLPKAVVMASCAVGGVVLPSAWQKTAGPPAAPNACEAAMTRTLEKYGFGVVKPAPEKLSQDPLQLLEGGNDAQKKAVFDELAGQLGAGVLLVSKVSLTVAGAASQFTVTVLAADLERGQAVWSDQRVKKFEAKPGLDRDKLLAAWCGETADRAVDEFYRAWLPRVDPGSCREFVLAVAGVPSYAVMKELEKKLKTEGPGVIWVMLSRMAPGELEYRIKSYADAQTFSDWLSRLRPGGLVLKVISADEGRIQAQLSR